MTRPTATRSNRSATSWAEDWPLQARCSSEEPDALFVTGAAQHHAKRICGGCPVRGECLAEALDNGIEEGVWGGATERERRALLRRHSGVKSWRQLLQDVDAGLLRLQEASA
jgi:WhiB family redox-sensing transcriptional regulator